MGSPTRKLCSLGALARGSVRLVSGPAEAHSCRGPQGQLGAQGSRPENLTSRLSGGARGWGGWGVLG